MKDVHSKKLWLTLLVIRKEREGLLSGVCEGLSSESLLCSLADTGWSPIAIMSGRHLKSLLLLYNSGNSQSDWISVHFFNHPLGPRLT